MLSGTVVFFCSVTIAGWVRSHYCVGQCDNMLSAIPPYLSSFLFTFVSIALAVWVSHTAFWCRYLDLLRRKRMQSFGSGVPLRCVSPPDTAYFPTISIRVARHTPTVALRSHNSGNVMRGPQNRLANGPSGRAIRAFERLYHERRRQSKQRAVDHDACSKA